MATGAFAALALVALVGGRLLSPTLTRADVRTARVERGAIAATLTATGNVVPEVEKVIASPVDARVLAIRKRAGDLVAPGDVIVELDLGESQLAVDRLAHELAQKGNEEAKARLALDARLGDLAGEREVKSLALGAQRARTARDRDLHRRGFLSQDELTESELLLARAEVEEKRVAAAIRHAEAATRAEVRGLALARGTLAREAAEAKRRLELATTRADRKAVLTYVVSEEGAAVKQGEILARLADLSAFRVDASVSDAYVGRLRAGQAVQVVLGETDRLPGRIASIQPAIKNGAVGFTVALDDKASPLLRPNLRVDVLVVTDEKPGALRIARGPFAEGEGRREVFVVRGTRAVRTRVRLGLEGAQHLEILDGLAPGDEAIISDMTPYLHLRELGLR